MQLDPRFDGQVTQAGIDGAAGVPAPWLVDNVDLFPAAGRALDVACGKGRHALRLAAAGFAVTAVDRDTAALDRLRSQALRLELAVHIQAMDLEAPGVEFGADRFDLIVVTRYLHRPLVPHLINALSPGGILVYETFLAGQAERGNPTNPAYLLEPGELTSLVHPLEILRSREGDFDGALVSSVVARRRLTSGLGSAMATEAESTPAETRADRR